MFNNVTKLIICLMFVYLLDRAAGAGLRYLYFTPSEGKYHNLSYGLDSTRADIIIVGSSRASHSYVTQQLEDSLKVSCYNAGMWGTHFLHQYATLRTITDRYKPKIIIWDYWEGLRVNDIAYMELSDLAPFYDDRHPEVKKMLYFADPYKKFKMFSRVYPFNSTLLYGINKTMGLHKGDNGGIYDKGFLPLKNTLKEPLQVSELSGDKRPIDTSCVRLYRSAIRYCKQNNIKLYVIMSPYFGVYKKPANYDALAKNIADAEGVPFLSYLNDSTILSSASNFSDKRHMNVNGAHRFTDEVIKAIRKDVNGIIKQ